MPRRPISSRGLWCAWRTREKTADVHEVARSSWGACCVEGQGRECALCVCVCFPPFILDVRLVDVPAGILTVTFITPARTAQEYVERNTAV